MRPPPLVFPLLRAHLVSVAAAIEEQRLAALLAAVYPRLPLLQEAAEGGQPRAGAHHDDGRQRVGRQLEAGGADEDGGAARVGGARQDWGGRRDGALQHHRT